MDEPAAEGPPPDTAGEPRRTGFGRGLLWIVVAVLVVGGLLLSQVEIAYYSVSPGAVFDTGPLVEAADGVEVHPPEDGALAFPTISTGRVTVWEAFTGWLDPDVDVVEADKIRPPQLDDRALRQRNLSMMAESKDKAVGVAFERLGYDAITGDGAEVLQVEPGSAADGTLSPGDVVVALDGSDVDLHSDLIQLVREHAPGETVSLTVRDPAGATRTVDVTLGEREGEPGAPFLGVTLQTNGLRIAPPFDVTIESSGIGGPSAGLAFTLQVLDLLTAGELTGGRRVAATGTIELDGTVGPVGGVPQKTTAVREAGYELFLVPEGEAEEARERAGTSLQVIGVTDLDDALAALADAGGTGLALGSGVGPGVTG